MKRLIFILLLFATSALATTYTEFYVIGATGNNMNSGHTPDASPTFTATSGYWTNNTTSAVFFKSGLNPVAGGVTNGAWASVYYDGTSTNVLVALITAADDTADTITVSLTAKSGTAMASNEYATNTIRVGGAWRGPNNDIAYTGATDPRMQHPFGFVQNTMTNTAGASPCINFLAGTYTVTNAMTIANQGPVLWAGYTTTPRDGGRVVIDGGTSTAAYALLTITAGNHCFQDFTWTDNGVSGSQPGVIASGSGTELVFYRCAATKMGQSGWSTSASDLMFIECEATLNNEANTVNHGGFKDAGGNCLFDRCISRSNTTANSFGYSVEARTIILNSVSSGNGGLGFKLLSTAQNPVINCDSYANGGAGLDVTVATAQANFFVQNCNFFGNGGAGVNSSGSAVRNGLLLNCAFGSGTMTNALGNIGANLLSGVQGGVLESGTILYAADQTPWTDPNNGNFTLKSTATTLSAGRGSFLQLTVNSPTNTVSFPDIGAAQRASTNAAAASGGGSWPFAQ